MQKKIDRYNNSIFFFNRDLKPKRLRNTDLDYHSTMVHHSWLIIRAIVIGRGFKSSPKSNLKIDHHKVCQGFGRALVG